MHMETFYIRMKAGRKEWDVEGLQQNMFWNVTEQQDCNSDPNTISKGVL